MRSHAKSLPVIMYHYVNEYAGSITVSPACFEDHCKTLAENGWHGISLFEAEAFLTGAAALPAKSVLITFDDGFLDNYLYALPILAKYGHKAVIFPVSDRIEKSGQPRARVDDLIKGRVPEMPDVLRPVGLDELGYKRRRDVFCNRGEILEMKRSGIIGIACHGRGHYGVPIGPEYQDIRKPGRQLRTFYRTEKPLIWGMPAFKVKAGLNFRAFVPSPELEDEIRSLVPQEDAAADAFFSDPSNERQLRKIIDSYQGRLGRYESDQERHERMTREIVLGKEELESILAEPVQTLCWPWGQYSPEALQIARQAGFTVFFTVGEGSNPPGKPLAVHRFKGKAKPGSWLLNRCRIYARPWLGKIYARIRL